jgi:hypothetical protein
MRRHNRRGRRPCIDVRPLRLLAPALVVAFLALGELAYAFSDHYCGVVISSGSWCGRNDLDYPYTWNRASYPGSGSVTVCQRLLYANTRTVRPGSTCATNYSGTSYSSGAGKFEAEVTHFSGSTNHTVNGYAET